MNVPSLQRPGFAVSCVKARLRVRAADRSAVDRCGGCSGSVAELPVDVRALADGASEILVVTPVLASHTHLWTDDIDGARRVADTRLDAILGNLDSITSDSQQTHGVVGDDVPMNVFDDAVRTFDPDRILIAMRSRDHAWQGRNLVQKVRQRFDLPTTVFEIDREGQIAPT
jgi:hypothetical protein